MNRRKEWGVNIRRIKDLVKSRHVWMHSLFQAKHMEKMSKDLNLPHSLGQGDEGGL